MNQEGNQLLGPCVFLFMFVTNVTEFCKKGSFI